MDTGDRIDVGDEYGNSAINAPHPQHKQTHTLSHKYTRTPTSNLAVVGRQVKVGLQNDVHSHKVEDHNATRNVFVEVCGRAAVCMRDCEEKKRG